MGKRYLVRFKNLQPNLIALVSSQMPLTNGNGTQIEYRRGAAGDVEAHPQITERR